MLLTCHTRPHLNAAVKRRFRDDRHPAHEVRKRPECSLGDSCTSILMSGSGVMHIFSSLSRLTPFNLPVLQIMGVVCLVAGVGG